MPRQALVSSRRVPKPIKFEKRVYQLAPYDWRWTLRQLQTTGRSEYMVEVGSGHASGPADANRKVTALIESIEKREKAKWVKVK